MMKKISGFKTGDLFFRVFIALGNKYLEILAATAASATEVTKITKTVSASTEARK